MAFLICAYIYVSHPVLLGNRLKILTNKTFSDRTIVIDGNDYENCTFNNVTFEYNGGRVAFSHNTISGGRLATQNPDIYKGWFFLGKLGATRIPLLDENERPIPPGATWHN